MPGNIVGPQIRRIRYKRGMTQDVLAARCGRAGLDISRGTLAKIEAQVRCVNDEELLVLARTLGVKMDDLYPPKQRKA
jgi:transcriptional regulator with XRE-family HTH domain